MRIPRGAERVFLAFKVGDSVVTKPAPARDKCSRIWDPIRQSPKGTTTVDDINALNLSEGSRK